jgi:hypothetical protein
VNYADGAQNKTLDAPHPRNSRNPRLFLYLPLKLGHAIAKETGERCNENHGKAVYRKPSS